MLHNPIGRSIGSGIKAREPEYIGCHSVLDGPVHCNFTFFADGAAVIMMKVVGGHPSRSNHTTTYVPSKFRIRTDCVSALAISVVQCWHYIYRLSSAENQFYVEIINFAGGDQTRGRELHQTTAAGE